jgi:Transposase DDE domain
VGGRADRQAWSTARLRRCRDPDLPHDEGAVRHGAQIPRDQEIATVTADGAFDTRKCHDAIVARGAAAIIPPRKNAKPWKPDTLGAVARNENLRTSKRVGRTKWRRWRGYDRRSRAETKVHCVKLLGQRLPAQDFDRQVAEFQIRIAVLNGFTALGTPITEVAG